MENIQISDITIVASLGDTILLCTLNKDIDNPETKAIQFNLGDKTFAIDKIQKFLKFTPFEGVDVKDETLQNFLRNWIYRKLSSETFIDSLVAFTPDEESAVQKAYLSGLIPEDVIEKAWKKHPIGTTVTRKDGQKYIKVSETGNSDKDWELANKSKDGDPKAKQEGSSKSPEEVKPAKQATAKELVDHAKNTSETALHNAIKESPDPSVRVAAQNELDRREKKEKPQEPEKVKTRENKKEPEKKENDLTEKLRGMSDSQVQFYLDAPDGDVKDSAKEVLAERGLRTVSQKEYESEFKDYSGELTEAYKSGSECSKFYKKESNKIFGYLEENTEIGESVDEYVGSLFEPLRRYLSDPIKYEKVQREGNDSGKFLTRFENGNIRKMKDASENLSKLISDNKITENLTVFRAIKPNEFFENLGVGDIYEDKSFSSTSLVELQNFGRFRIKILAKKDSNICNLVNDEEFEYLIDKDSKFRVTGKDSHGITVELL